MAKWYYIILVLYLFSSCEENIAFNESQPTDTKSLSSFPKKLWGSYQNKDDYTILKINSTLIKSISDFDIKVCKTDLDSNNHLVNDTVYTIDTHEKTPVKIEGDSLVAHIHSVDTLFLISEKNILKKFKGYCFLNFADSIYWHVKKLSLSKGILSISTISTEDDIKNLKEVTETTADTTNYEFSPTKRQFKKFIKKGGFKDTDRYERIRE